jgi:hypothetical protein
VLGTKNLSDILAEREAISQFMQVWKISSVDSDLFSKFFTCPMFEIFT